MLSKLASSTGAPSPAISASFPVGVSVVIPSYNYAAYLPRAIDSALRQTHPRLEIIVVDDGSTDNTRELVAAYGDKVRYVYQHNAGLPAARNMGISVASHEYIAFLDSDDEWLPEMVEKLMQCFAQLPPDFGLVAAQSRYIDAQSTPIEEKKNYLRLTGEITVPDLLFMTRFSPSAVIARKRALVEGGLFDTTLRSSEDRDMWIRLGARHRLQMIPEQLALIRKHGQNMSSHADRMKLNMRKVLGKSFRNGLVPREAAFFWLRVMAAYYYQTALMYRGSRRLGQALKDILKSLLCWPLFLNARHTSSTVSFVRLRTLARICLDAFQAPR